MNKEDKYQLGLVLLGLLNIILLGIIGIMCIVINDLNSTIDMHKNTIGVCNIDLKQIQNENEELRERLRSEK